MPPRDRIPAPILFGIATLFGVSSTFQAWGLHSLKPGEHDITFAHLLLLNLVYWYVPALLAPAIMRLAGGDGLRRARWPLQAIVHGGGALTYAIVHTAVMTGCRVLLALPGGKPPMGEAATWLTVRRDFLTQLDWLLMTYLFFVGLAYALAYRRESETSALTAANLETRLVEAQLRALQRQLHPHFLFNTLNTIAGLLHTDPKAADLMLDRLGDLLRMTLHTSGTQEVRLQEELEVVQKYLEIEQTRFGDRLRVSMDVAPDAIDALVPNLLLQPLVENAIRHGVAPKARPGSVSVRASRDGADLRIEIRDSGDGVAPDRVFALNGGVGLQNTRARLQHLYGSSHQLRFTNMDDGFCIAVTIPFRVEAARDAAPQLA